jgi:Na+/H+-dicarboxylate symporter
MTGQHFGGFSVLLSVILVALLSGVVMGGIPGGGFMSEMMIVSIYGLPLEMLPMLSMIGMLVDAPATAINVVGDNIVAVTLSKWIRTT